MPDPEWELKKNKIKLTKIFNQPDLNFRGARERCSALLDRIAEKYSY